ncbi:MAG: hypothetical protein IKZ61_03675 [Prevotella sp.]|nr:hypothetical protein [Prevotella sp.]
MKKIYVKPLVEETKMGYSSIMVGASEVGQMDPGGAWAKRRDVVEEDEEDDEELESFKPEKIVLSDVFSNDYIQKVWE